MEARNPVDDLAASLNLPSEDLKFADEPGEGVMAAEVVFNVADVPVDIPPAASSFTDHNVPDYTVDQIGDLQAGHRNYFTGIVGHTLGRYGISWDQGLAEDIVQIAFAELHRKLTTAGEDGKRRPFDPANRGLFRFAVTLTARRAHDYSKRAATSNERAAVTDMQDPTLPENILPQSPSAEEQWLRKEALLPQHVEPYVRQMRTIFGTLTPAERRALLEYYQKLVELDTQGLTVHEGKARTRAVDGQGHSGASRISMHRARHKFASSIEILYGRDIINDPTFLGAFTLFLAAETHEYNSQDKDMA